MSDVTNKLIVELSERINNLQEAFVNPLLMILESCDVTTLTGISNALQKIESMNYVKNCNDSKYYDGESGDDDDEEET